MKFFWRYSSIILQWLRLLNVYIILKTRDLDIFTFLLIFIGKIFLKLF